MNNVHDLRNHLIGLEHLVEMLERAEENTELADCIDKVLEETLTTIGGLLEPTYTDKKWPGTETEGAEPDPKPDEMLRHFRPDEVAECWEGVDRKLYQSLWGLMEKLPPMPGPDEIADMCPNDIRTYDRSVAAYWGKLTQTDRKVLNRLAEENCR